MVLIACLTGAGVGAFISLISGIAAVRAKSSSATFTDVKALAVLTLGGAIFWPLPILYALILAAKKLTPVILRGYWSALDSRPEEFEDIGPWKLEMDELRSIETALEGSSEVGREVAAISLERQLRRSADELCPSG